MEIFKQLELDTWYKIPIYIGGILFIISFFQEGILLTNIQLVFLSLTLIFIGLGEWKNAHVEISYKPSNIYTGPGATIEIPVRKETALGIFFWFLAGVSLGIEIGLFI